MTRATVSSRDVRPRAEAGPPGEGPLPMLFAGAFGGLLGLSLLKFGNPAIMEKFVLPPTDIYEWVLNSWPVIFGYILLTVVMVTGLFVARWKTNLPWLIVALPAIWLAWEYFAGTQTVDRVLTRVTLVHFATCAICFYLGLFSLSRVRRLWPFWAGLIAGFLIVLLWGFQQHFGGLEQSRQYYFLYIYPHLKEPPPPEFIKKISTTRIFSTLFYANTLAGVILLTLPCTLAALWSLKRQLTPAARRFLVGMVGASALACLYWSGSKAGWLLMLVIGLAGALFLPFKRRLKLMMIGVALVLGLAGFFVKYAGFFQRGAPSAVARVDYWRAAVQTVAEKPLFGTGPGTFAIPYQKVKRPESEMARLVHNDYLQQASDSGVIGILAYIGLVVGVLVCAFRKGRVKEDGVALAVWLGVLGWALQSTVEFGLYIPAVAWPAFCFMGWLLGRTDFLKENSNRAAQTRVMPGK